MAERSVYPNPRLPSQEEEAAYWQEHSPLLEGYEVVQQRGSTKRASFLSVRLDGAEIEALRKAAARRGLRPSSLARNLIIQGLQADDAAKDLAQRVKALEDKLQQMEHLVTRAGQ